MPRTQGGGTRDLMNERATSNDDGTWKCRFCKRDNLPTKAAARTHFLNCHPQENQRAVAARNQAKLAAAGPSRCEICGMVQRTKEGARQRALVHAHPEKTAVPCQDCNWTQHPTVRVEGTQSSSAAAGSTPSASNPHRGDGEDEANLESNDSDDDDGAPDSSSGSDIASSGALSRPRLLLRLRLPRPADGTPSAPRDDRDDPSLPPNEVATDSSQDSPSSEESAPSPRKSSSPFCPRTSHRISRSKARSDAAMTKKRGNVSSPSSSQTETARTKRSRAHKAQSSKPGSPAGRDEEVRSEAVPAHSPRRLIFNAPIDTHDHDGSEEEVETDKTDESTDASLRNPRTSRQSPSVASNHRTRSPSHSADPGSTMHHDSNADHHYFDEAFYPYD
ncbi:hypothetical protein JCM16303_003829 [Sporobolomyces ruberrimus]